MQWGGSLLLGEYISSLELEVKFTFRLLEFGKGEFHVYFVLTIFFNRCFKFKKRQKEIRNVGRISCFYRAGKKQLSADLVEKEVMNQSWSWRIISEFYRNRGRQRQKLQALKSIPVDARPRILFHQNNSSLFYVTLDSIRLRMEVLIDLKDMVKNFIISIHYY